MMIFVKTAKIWSFESINEWSLKSELHVVTSTWTLDRKGIGQILASSHRSTDHLHCVKVPVLAGVKNDLTSCLNSGPNGRINSHFVSCVNSVSIDCMGDDLTSWVNSGPIDCISGDLANCVNSGPIGCMNNGLTSWVNSGPSSCMNSDLISCINNNPTVAMNFMTFFFGLGFFLLML